MTESPERVCVGCNDTEEMAHLEMCSICNRFYCADCAYKGGFGRKFCSAECGRAWYFTGDNDDDEDASADD
jgi:hypothetical protein